MSIVNPYDKAHDLGRALKSCDEFKALQKAMNALQEVPGAQEKLADFMQKQMAIDLQKMQSGESSIEPAEMEAIAMQYKELNSIPEVAAFLVAERAFMRLFNDIQAILQKAISPEE